MCGQAPVNTDTATEAETRGDMGDDIKKATGYPDPSNQQTN